MKLFGCGNEHGTPRYAGDYLAVAAADLSIFKHMRTQKSSLAFMLGLTEDDDYT